MSENRKHIGQVKEGIIYSFFSIAIPILLILSIDLILRTLFIDLASIPWWTISISFVCVIISSRVLIHLEKKQAETGSYIRIHTFIYLPIAAIIFVTLHKSPRFLIYLTSLYTMQWLILFAIYNKYKDYLNFLKLVNIKYKSDSNQTHIKNNLITKDAHQSLKKLNSLIKTIHYILFFAVSVLVISNVQISITTLFLCLTSIFCGAAFSLSISVCLDEYQFMIDGFSVDKSMKQKRFTYIMLLLFIALILMFLGIQNSRFFTPEDILDFLKWLFPKKEIPRATSFYIEPDFKETKPALLNPGEFESTPLFDLGTVLDFMGMILRPVLLIAFIYFIFKPLIEQGVRKLTNGIKPLEFFKKSLTHFFSTLTKNIKKIIQNIVNLFQSSDTPKSIRTITSSYRKVQAEDKKSYRKRFQTNQVVKMFTKLIQWSQKQNIVYHPSLAPNEYINMIIHKNPHQKHSLETICHIFEEALFSNHIIKRETIKYYNNKIKEIIK